ncbi:hypothetical protein [Rhodopirellula sp. P2]|uniref:hypothetical protein n=1 Tax=Rhodopirellula sp. P2 TaxID=2127060 RepID=UPI0023679304|nr:hypothetical protein [Rhodopirellula sp. P2]WDQ15954.1 hypothetical protein PSR62_20290 [Rhodopirellula sp. P2]
MTFQNRSSPRVVRGGGFFIPKDNKLISRISLAALFLSSLCVMGCGPGQTEKVVSPEDLSAYETPAGAMEDAMKDATQEAKKRN